MEHHHHQVPIGRVTVDLKTWGTGTFILTSAVVALIAGHHKITSDMTQELRREILLVENRWVERVAEVEERVRKDVEHIDSRVDVVIQQELQVLSERLVVMEQKQILPEAVRRITNLEKVVEELKRKQ